MSHIVDPWFTVEEIDPMTFAISEYGHWEKVHSYLLLGEERAALIDTGLGIDHIKRITDQLTDLPIIVLSTHVHADHIGSHAQFDTIYVHQDDADWLINGIKGLPIEQIRKDMGRDITVPIPESFDPDTYIPYQGEPTGLLSDGDLIDLGNRKLTIYHTPATHRVIYPFSTIKTGICSRVICFIQIRRFMRSIPQQIRLIWSIL